MGFNLLQPGSYPVVGQGIQQAGQAINSTNFNPLSGNASPTNATPQASQNPYGQAYAANQGVAGVGGTDSAGQAGTIGQLQQMAAGGGPNPAAAQLQQATMQGQALGQAQAGSARGQMGLAGAQHNASANTANIGQQAAQTGSVLEQQQQFQSIQALQQAQTTQRAQDLMAMGMNSNDAIAQAQLELGQNTQNQNMVGQLLSAGGGAVSGLLSVGGL